ncbi:hypothetical protein DM860_004583 [Cuscuta australis]|uniref:Uncharacterized protein n=1 Tax=Cuscuta australis TaxID=267555 RepID=A0A328E852_9ASTE|nr:hypothetical protein DM860_004583 [Cuscuta australis]
MDLQSFKKSDDLSTWVDSKNKPPIFQKKVICGIEKVIGMSKEFRRLTRC